MTQANLPLWLWTQPLPYNTNETKEIGQSNVTFNTTIIFLDFFGSLSFLAVSKASKASLLATLSFNPR
jgi:hypothetical protein